MLDQTRGPEAKKFLKPEAHTAPAGLEVYRFGAWTLIPSRMQLKRDETELPLTPKAFDMLFVLVRNRGMVLSVSDLMEAVWPGVFVERANIHQTISVVRKALGGGIAARRLVASVPRRGYRFTGEVEVIHPATELIGTAKGRSSPYSSEAMEYYRKGFHSFEKWSGASSKSDMENAIALFREAIRIEPKWALPQSQLAYACTVMAMFFEPGTGWEENASRLLDRARTLDTRAAEVNIVESELLWSPVKGFQIESAVRALKQAQNLNPDAGQAELGIICAHQGFEDPALELLDRALHIEPASLTFQSRLAEAFIWLGSFKPAIAGYDRLIAIDPLNPGHFVFSAIACIYLGELREARRRNDRALELKPSDPIARSSRALLMALDGDFEGAEQQLSSLTLPWKLIRSGHHVTQNIAGVQALQGNAEMAVEWLRNTIRMGMCNHRLIQQDPCLERVRNTPEFRDFMSDTGVQSRALLAAFR